MAGELVPQPPNGQFLVFTDGGANLRVRIDGQTVWLPQAGIAELFQTTKQNVSLHLKNIFEEGELSEEAVVKEYLTTAADGKQYRTLHYNLEAILAVGYRVRSPIGTAFRQWATARLAELLVKGFTMDDDRIKAGATAGDEYFEELLARIRDIRSSERLFYQKILDIYSTASDYDKNSETTVLFFKTVQNKMHYAAHGRTAAEVIVERADASAPNMGRTSWKNAPGGPVRKGDAVIAKNYLDAKELETLNRIVSAYLEFAELQAINRQPVRMAEYAARLDEYLRLLGRGVLTNPGSVSHEAAMAKVEAEYAVFHQAQINGPQPVDAHFEEVVGKVKKIEQSKKKRKNKDGDQ